MDDFRHEAFLYADDAAFVDGTSAFVQDGFAEGAAMLVALPRRHLDLLRDALGADAKRVDFLDMHAIGVNPARIIPAWQRFVDERGAHGRPLRGIGEPIWPQRRSVELGECALHERLIDVAFDGGPGWRLMCPYDATQLPPEVVTGSLRWHRHSCGDTPAVDESYEGWDGAASAFAAPLPDPPTDAVVRPFGAADLVDVREEVAAFALAAGLSGARAGVLLLAASELATNSVRHGGGAGVSRRWTEPGAVVFEISDAGRIDDLLVGRRSPALSREGGRGLFLVNQMCDLVQLRSSDGGTTVRVTSWI